MSTSIEGLVRSGSLIYSDLPAVVDAVLRTADKNIKSRSTSTYVIRVAGHVPPFKAV